MPCCAGDLSRRHALVTVQHHLWVAQHTYPLAAAAEAVEPMLPAFATGHLRPVDDQHPFGGLGLELIQVDPDQALLCLCAQQETRGLRDVFVRRASEVALRVD